VWEDWGWIAWFLDGGVVLIALGMVAADEPVHTEAARRTIGALIGTGLILLAVFACSLVGMGFSAAMGRDLDGRYAISPLKGWFDSLHSGKGPCCSDADGTAISDVDWNAPGQGGNESRYYRVRIEGMWILVPDEALITEPNRAGRAMVWPVYTRPLNAPAQIEIRCFMPGSFT
jgi:hypothetical protein